MPYPKVMVALGANLPGPLGSPRATLAAAVRRLGDSTLKIESVSRFFATPSFPAGSGPDYVNAAVVLSGMDDPAEILNLLHAIEAEFGRIRGQRWGHRTLDLDLLAVGALVLPDAATHAAWREMPLDEQIGRVPDRLILPHPRLQDRAFVLIPLADIAPDWRHPILGLTVREMADALPETDKSAVIPL